MGKQYKPITPEGVRAEKQKVGRNFQREPQTIMREEMTAGVHKLDVVLEEVAGVFEQSEASIQEVREEALQIIHSYEPEVRLSLAQWAHVQQLVEKGVMRGYQRYAEEDAADRG